MSYYDDWDGYRPIQVRLECTGEFVEESEVEFLDISENIFGEDVMLYLCPVCGEEHESKRFG
jgi:hypothetical protein